MARYSGKKRVSETTREEGESIARSTQRPGQTKEQTRLIAQGIERGIDLYKKQHKARARELDRKLRQVERGGKDEPVAPEAADVGPEIAPPRSRPLLPWLLLAMTWLGIGVYVLAPGIRDLLTG